MQRRHVLALIPFIMAIGVGLQGCNTHRDSVATPRSGKLKVVATFSVIGDLVQNVAGDSVELTTLVGPDNDVHSFEPAPSDAVALAKADAILENGAGLETWLDGLYKSSQSKARRVVLSQGLKLHEAEEEEHKKDDKGAAKDAGKKHEELDPHIWHDVQNVIHEVELIRDNLMALDPPNSEKYKTGGTPTYKNSRTSTLGS